MKKKLIVLIITIITIFNLISLSLLFLDINLMKAPEATVNIDIVEINAEEAVIHTTIDVANPNDFDLVAKNLELVTTTPDGKEVSRVLVEGGSVSPHKNKTFVAISYAVFDGRGPERLKSKITGEVGLNIFFIQKTLPFTLNIITSVEDVIKQIMPPVINAQVDFEDVSQKRINISGFIDVYNPNSFDIFVDNMSVKIKTETGKNVGHLDVLAGNVSAKSSAQLDSSGRIIIEALNAEMLIINFSGSAGLKIAGYEKSVSFNADAEINMPDPNVLFSDVSMDLVIKGDYRTSIRGIIDRVVFEIHNPHKIEFLAEKITLSLYRIDMDEEKLIIKGVLGGGVVKPQSTTSFKKELLIPYSKLIPSKGNRLIPDSVKIVVRADLTLPGVNYSISVGIIGYNDFRILN